MPQGQPWLQAEWSAAHRLRAMPSGVKQWREPAGPALWLLQRWPNPHPSSLILSVSRLMLGGELTSC